MVRSLLKHSGSVPVAGIPLRVLLTLAPFYTEEFFAMDERFRQKYTISR